MSYATRKPAKQDFPACYTPAAAGQHLPPFCLTFSLTDSPCYDTGSDKWVLKTCKSLRGLHFFSCLERTLMHTWGSKSRKGNAFQSNERWLSHPKKRKTCGRENCQGLCPRTPLPFGYSRFCASWLVKPWFCRVDKTLCPPLTWCIPILIPHADSIWLSIQAISPVGKIPHQVRSIKIAKM